VTFDEAGRAIKKGDIVRLRQALESGLDPNLSNKFCWTLLMVAAMSSGNTSIGSLLLDHGADPNRKNKWGDTALSSAGHTGHPSFVRFLLDRGASLDGFPFGKTFEDFLEWAEKYGTGSPQSMRRAKSVVSAARGVRNAPGNE
jgi:ankyrin repeat protein